MSGLALKKHLSKMEIKPTDLVLFSVPMGAPDDAWRGFAEEVAKLLKEQGIEGPLLVIRPGFHLDKLDEATLAEHGLVRKTE